MIEERLLGFDVREAWMNPHEPWDEVRRTTFLLDLDAAKPLSTDTMVWPSVFDTGQGIGLPDAERARLGLAGLAVPSWIGPNAGLWEDLSAMRLYLVGNWPEPRSHSIVAVTWCSDAGFSDGGNVGPYLGATTPRDLDSSWTLLGYDVSDGSLVSGLTNCGYSPDEVDELRRDWSRHLNPSHLFDDPDLALRFRDLSGRRVHEHAPFFVYGLYLIEGSTQE